MQEMQPGNQQENTPLDVNLQKMEDQASAEVSMLIKAGKDLNYMGKAENLPQVIETVKALSDADQEALAQDYFDKTIGKSISDNKYAYEVYLKLKGTAFARKFHDLEDARLKASGPEGFYAGFNL